MSPEGRYRRFAWYSSGPTGRDHTVPVVLLLLLPAIRIVPALYRWRMTSRIFRWYRALQKLERDALRPTADAERREELMRHLDHIEHAVAKIEVPPAYYGSMPFHVERDSLT